MHKQTKLPIKQCTVCFCYFIADDQEASIQHMQTHIHNSRYQGPQRYRCRYNPMNTSVEVQCGGKYDNSRDLAIHVISKHCRIRYEHETTKKYWKAKQNGRKEKQDATMWISHGWHRISNKRIDNPYPTNPPSNVGRIWEGNNSYNRVSATPYKQTNSITTSPRNIHICQTTNNTKKPQTDNGKPLKRNGGNPQTVW